MFSTTDEKYQFTCMIDFRRVFRDGENVERINVRGLIVFNISPFTLIPFLGGSAPPGSAYNRI
jgi:hypothetical protein